MRHPNPSEELTLLLLSQFEPMSYLDLSKEAGIKPTCAAERLKRLHRRGVIHIVQRVRTGNKQMACYGIGSAEDAALLPRLDRKEIWDKWVAKIKRIDGGRKWRAMLTKYQRARDEKAAGDPMITNRRRMAKIKYEFVRHGRVKKIPAVETIDPLLAILMGKKAA